MKGSAPSRAGNQGLDIVDGSAPSETDEESICVFSIRRTGNVGAPATAGVMPHHGKEKNEETLRMMVRSWTDWNPIREPLGTSSFKEGAVVAVGE